MTPDQYQALLEELARAAGLPEPSSLLEHGRLRIDGRSALLVHDAAHDPGLLQLRMVLGEVPRGREALLMSGLLRANYIGGYAGECVFSLFPTSDEVVVTMRMRLAPALTAQELWQSLSETASQATRAWGDLLEALPA